MTHASLGLTPIGILSRLQIAPQHPCITAFVHWNEDGESGRDTGGRCERVYTFVSPSFSPVCLPIPSIPEDYSGAEKAHFEQVSLQNNVSAKYVFL